MYHLIHRKINSLKYNHRWYSCQVSCRDPSHRRRRDAALSTSLTTYPYLYHNMPCRSRYSDAYDKQVLWILVKRKCVLSVPLIFGMTWLHNQHFNDINRSRHHIISTSHSKEIVGIMSLFSYSHPRVYHFIIFIIFIQSSRRRYSTYANSRHQVFKSCSFILDR